MRGLMWECLIELLDRKVLWIYGALTFLALLFTVISRSGHLTIDIGGNTATTAGGMLGMIIVRGMETYLSFLVFLTVMATAGLIPNMLVKGRADYYLSKPISRVSLLGRKLFSIWLVYGSLIVLCGIINSVAIFITMHWFDARILYLFGFALISLFVWLSITGFAAISFGSNSLAIMTAFVFWVAQWLLRFHDSIGQLFGSKAVQFIGDALYYIVPKSSQVSELSISLASRNPVLSWQPLLTTVAFAIVAYIVTLQLFKRANY